MARGTGSDPINETRMGERERRPRTRREREGGGPTADGRVERTNRDCRLAIADCRLKMISNLTIDN